MKRPADTNQLAKRIVGLAVGEANEEEPTSRQLGGMASASKLAAEQRRERAKKAAAARWASALTVIGTGDPMKPNDARESLVFRQVQKCECSCEGLLVPGEARRRGVAGPTQGGATEPSAGEREGAPLARKEPSAGEREGEPLAGENPEPKAPAVGHSQSGVDLTMLRWMASKTPEERLRILQNNVNAILNARNGRNRS